VEPLVSLLIPGEPLVLYARMTPADVPAWLDELAQGRVPRDKALCRIEAWDHHTGQIEYGRGCADIPLWDALPFFEGQQKIVLRNCGLINPESLEEYIAVGGYFGLCDALHKPGGELVIEEVTKAKLRGRGGAGYPTGVKWNLLRQAPGAEKVLICNADEGDPGAYMNRNEIESDPHMLVEGMAIGAVATGATRGVVYLRAEYPLAVQRLQKAVDDARAAGLLGEGILGTAFCFDIQLVEGAGAFVCGEETAMIASLEGQAGRPRPRPPFPAQAGLWGKPTNINNVETWCNIPVIMARGGSWFAGVGTQNSTGTKVFSLVGKVANTGLVELPMGMPLKQIVYGIGGGSPDGKHIKAVQTGGPSGGCIPAKLFDTPVDYESLGQLGAIMGSGGMVVMDEDNCMVDVARYFLEFTHAESCGKCIPCRMGLDEAVRLLRKICDGQGEESDLDQLEALMPMIRDASLCGLGQTAPNPVLTTLRYFRHEYEEHIRAKRCYPGVCEALYLSPCENRCPLNMRIPAFMELIKEERMDEAAEMIWLDNPLPASTGRICQHPCESLCRRGQEDAPVNMREIHRFVADMVFDGDGLARLKAQLLDDRLAATGHAVAVVGAGPAGLTAAFYLALLGHSVTVYDEHEQAGGMLRYSLPEYRLPRAIIDHEVAVLEHLGIRFVFGQKLGAGLALDSLEQSYDAVFLAMGTWQETQAGITNEDNPHVWHAIAFLEQVALGHPPDVGQRVVVVGGGNAAVDSARTALRLGAKVDIVYRRMRPDMPAIAEEVEDAEAEGVDVHFLWSPQRVVTNAEGRVTGLEVRRTEPGDFDASGRRTPVSTEQVEVWPCDAVIMAVGEKPDPVPLQRAALQVRQNQTAAVDWLTYATNREKVFAGGDLVTGASNVSATMSTGKAAARSMDRKLMGRDRLDEALKTFTYGREVPREPEGGARRVPDYLDAAVRRGSFDEVVRSFDRERAVGESARCLRCDVKAGCAVRGKA
jgi:NADH-quinone oxidoreductase subunit F